MRLVETYDNLLIEGELENIREKWLKKFDYEHTVVLVSEIRDFNFYSDEFIKTIPTPKKYLNKYYTLINDSIDSFALKSLMEDLLGYFQTWFELKKLGYIKEDIISIGNIIALKTIVSEASNKLKEKEEEKKIDPIYEDNEWYVIKVNSTQASCKYGQGTRWCISATHDNRYTEYSNKHWNVYFIIDKNNTQISPTYKLALLVDMYDPNNIQVWDSEDDKIIKIDYLRRFIPQIFEACISDSISKRHKLTLDDVNTICDWFETDSHFRQILGFGLSDMDYDHPENPKQVIGHYFDTEFNTGLAVLVVIDLVNHKMIFEVVDLEDDDGNTICDAEVNILSYQYSDLLNSLIRGFNLVVKNPKFVKYLKSKQQPLSDEEYFAKSGLYGDIEKNENTKVPIERFKKAIKLLKLKGKVSITELRRETYPYFRGNDSPSHNMKPLLKSLYKFGLISLERNGRNIFIVPTPKLVKSKIEDLI